MLKLVRKRLINGLVIQNQLTSHARNQVLRKHAQQFTQQEGSLRLHIHCITVLKRMLWLPFVLNLVLMQSSVSIEVTVMLTAFNYGPQPKNPVFL